jgi:hypothetical protein
MPSPPQHDRRALEPAAASQIRYCNWVAEAALTQSRKLLALVSPPMSRDDNLGGSPDAIAGR